MRVQYTLKDTTVDAIKKRAASLGIHPSRLVEEYLTVALLSGAAVTLTPQSLSNRTITTPANAVPRDLTFEEMEAEALGST